MEGTWCQMQGWTGLWQSWRTSVFSGGDGVLSGLEEGSRAQAKIRGTQL